MQKVHERVGGDPDVQQDGREAAVLAAGELEEDGAEQGEREREQPLYQKGGQKSAHDGVHNGVCLKKSPRAQQSRGAQPVREI